MSYPQKGRKNSRTQSTSPYYAEEQGPPLNAGRQMSTGSSAYSQPSYNETAPQQTSPVSPRGDPPQQGPYTDRSSAQALPSTYLPEQSYPYAPPSYTNQHSQYRGSQADYGDFHDNYRGGYVASQNNYRESQDPRGYNVNEQYQNYPYDPRSSAAYQNNPYNPNVIPNNPPVPKQGDGQFDIYSDFNNAQPQSHDLDEYDDSGTLTPTLRNSESPTGVPADPSGQKSYSDQLTQGLISEKEPRSPRCCCCSRKICVITTFIILVIIGIVAFFVWPRIPTVSILDSGAEPVGTPTISLSQKRLIMKFNLPVEIKNPDNWVPIRFNEIDAQVFDQNTISTYSRPIATGNVTNYVLPARTSSTILKFPLLVDYIGNSTTDPVILDFQSACTPPPDGGQATTLNVRADITLSVWGISWIYKPHISVGLSNLVCPYSQISNYLNDVNLTNLISS